jgi:type I restriction-modification system DNA methylase subunit
MELTKNKGKENLVELVAKFEKELNAGRVNEYNEEATKTAFIQPFLRNVLGWDVSNRDEVSPEEKISHGRVDYGLKIEGQIKIFIEVKPPKADLTKHITQAVSYGYNRKGVPFVLLTDFEGLKLFDVTVKPDARNPLKGLKLDLNWQKYLEKFDKIWCLSKESVLQGELEKLLLIKPKERLPVDKAILDDLKQWRAALAKDIFKNNPDLFHSEDREKDADFLKEITQRILDRISFMRSCEDRKLVHRRSLKVLFEERSETVGTNTMVFLNEEFKHYNFIFDSDLFRPQEWEKNLAVDFKVMKNIIMETYNPYQFDVIPLEVLGNIYEQYLGYTIRLTDHQVKYELKPEVRKAGGIYYTPEYIVDYIIKNTVVKLLRELPASRFLSFRAKRGTSSKTKKLRILDPACGSGSFLIRAYEEMLNYYKNRKKTKTGRRGHSDPERSEGKESQLLIKHEEQEPVLTIEEKSQILREHIFGVDIDEQAVEVTKLSLMLKMLEGEFGVIPGRNILPMLDKNIRCGNSLISGDTLELKKYFGDDWYKVKPFNWNEEFRKIMVEEGGFDGVIGNPPWVFTRHVALEKNVKKYYQYRYFHGLTGFQTGKSKQSGKVNLYAIFLLQGIRLLSKKGMFGFILLNNLLRATVYDIVRKYVLDNCCIDEIVDLKTGVFENVTAATVILILEKNRENSQNIVKIIDNRYRNKIDISQTSQIPQISFHNNISYAFNIFVSPLEAALFKKMESKSTKLGELVDVCNGIATKKNKEGIYDRIINKKCKPLLIGKDIQRYSYDFNNRYIEYDRNKLHRPRRESIFTAKEKLIMQRIGGILITAYDGSQYYTFNSVNNLIAKGNCSYSVKFLLGVINSRLMRFYYICNFTNRSKLTVNISKTYLDKLPVRTIDFANSADEKQHDDLIALVDVMLDLNKKVQTARGSEKEQIQRQTDKTDREIDDLVYKLYGITDEERKIIEEER